MTIRRTADDIRAAIELIRHELWVDPTDYPHVWHARVYDRDGFEIGNGDAHTAGLV